MEIAVEKVSELARKVKVTIPAPQVSAKVQAQLVSLRDKVSLPGFRPGKVPQAVLEQRYGAHVHHDVIEDLLRSSLNEAITQNNLEPAGRPKIDLGEHQYGKALEYTAAFEEYPKIKLIDLSKEKVERPSVELTDADVDQDIEKLRRSAAEWTEVERPAQAGDRLTIDFVGTIKGEVFKGGSGKGMCCELGEGHVLPDFENSLYGAQAGDIVKIKLKFPKDYAAKDLAGKKAQFEVTVHEVESPSLPELNEDLIKEWGVEAGTVEALQMKVRESLTAEVTKLVDNVLHRRIVDLLRAKHKVALPECLVESEIDYLTNAANSGAEDEDSGQTTEIDYAKSPYRDEALERVAASVIFRQLVSDWQLSVSLKDLKQHVIEDLGWGRHLKNLDEFFTKDSPILNQLYGSALEKLVYTRLAETVVLVDKPMSLAELRRLQE